MSEKLPVDAGVMVSKTVEVSLSEPEAPVIVTVEVPTAAEQATLIVITVVPLNGFGLNPTVTPLGKPDAASVMLPLNPFSAVSVRVNVPLPHWGMDSEGGEIVSEKLGGVEALTARTMVVVSVKVPETPVMVMVEDPTAAEELAVSVRTLDPVVGLVANPAVTPLGKPEAERVTLPVNPPTSVTVIVSVALAP